jgi:hypothetical protein
MGRDLRVQGHHHEVSSGYAWMPITILSNMGDSGVARSLHNIGVDSGPPTKSAERHTAQGTPRMGMRSFKESSEIKQERAVE